MHRRVRGTAGYNDRAVAREGISINLTDAGPDQVHCPRQLSAKVHQQRDVRFVSLLLAMSIGVPAPSGVPLRNAVDALDLLHVVIQNQQEVLQNPSEVAQGRLYPRSCLRRVCRQPGLDGVQTLGILDADEGSRLK
ncbi:MAG: hypothetical protein M3350_06365 [Actinomycetota bacterium]|nr:hypothetical protein [Actinomycetota bacterium]